MRAIDKWVKFLTLRDGCQEKKNLYIINNNNNNNNNLHLLGNPAVLELYHDI